MLVIARVIQGLRRRRHHERQHRAGALHLPARACSGAASAINALVVATSSATGPDGRRRRSCRWRPGTGCSRSTCRSASSRCGSPLRALPATPRAGAPLRRGSGAVLNAATFGLLMIAVDELGRGQGCAGRRAELAAAAVVGGGLHPPGADAARADAAGRSVPPPDLRAVGRDVDLLVHGADARLRGAAVLVRGRRRHCRRSRPGC